MREQDITKIIPYIFVDGVPTFKDSEIMALWDRMEKDGSKDSVFYDASIISRTQFLEAMKSSNNFLILMYWEEELVGIMWANRFQGNFAQNHFCFFKNVWGKRSIIHIVGKAACLYLLKNLDLDMLLGLVPKRNTQGVKAAVGAGAKIVGELPYGSYIFKTDTSESAVIFSFTLEEKNEGI